MIKEITLYRYTYKAKNIINAAIYQSEWSTLKFDLKSYILLKTESKVITIEEE